MIKVMQNMEMEMDIPAATQATTAITSTPDILTRTGEGRIGLV
jgi:hypothetical protein